MLKKDNLRFGLIVGFLVPIFGSIIIVFYYYYKYFSNYSEKFTYKDVIIYLVHQKQLMTALLSILIVANIAIFTYYINTRKDRTAKGVFIATLMYGFLSVIWKFFY